MTCKIASFFMRLVHLLLLYGLADGMYIPHLLFFSFMGGGIDLRILRLSLSLKTILWAQRQKLFVKIPCPTDNKEAPTHP